MIAIETPVEFKLIARNFAADILDFAKSLDDFVAVGLIGIDQQQAAAVRPFLKSLLAENMSREALAEFWSSLPSGLHIDGEGVRNILVAILDRLEQEPYLTGSFKG